MPAQAVRINGTTILVDSVERVEDPVGSLHVSANGSRSWIAALDDDDNPIIKSTFTVQINKADQATRDVVANARQVFPVPYRHHDGVLHYCQIEPGDYKETATYAGTADGVAYDISVTLRE